jgi:hypothetical protein
MDLNFPYADDRARLQLLYRLAAAPPPGRLLVVGAPGDAALIGQGWPGAVSALDSVGADSTGGEFDVVALPWGLARPDAASLLAFAYRSLVPGGLVVGHLTHRLGLRELVRWRATPKLATALLRGGVALGPSSCRALLARSGFDAPACFYVQPSIQSPMGLIPCEPRVARATFLRAIRSARAHFTPAAYATRYAAAALGLGGMQQSELFFWAHKPC